MSKLLEIVEDREAWCVAVHGLQRAGHDLVSEEQQLPGILIKVKNKTYFINLKNFSGTFLAVQLVKTTLLQGAWVQPLAGELVSYMPCDAAKNWEEKMSA